MFATPINLIPIAIAAAQGVRLFGIISGEE